MNIQVPLLIAGITATTSVGIGTIAVNTGAISIDELSTLTSGVTTAGDMQTPIDVLVPVLGSDVPTPTVTAGSEATATDSVGSTGTSSQASSRHSSGGTSTAPAPSTPSTPSDGTSAGSSTGGGTGGGSHEDDDSDEREDDEDHEDHEDNEDDD